MLNSTINLTPKALNTTRKNGHVRLSSDIVLGSPEMQKKKSEKVLPLSWQASWIDGPRRMFAYTNRWKPRLERGR